MVRHGAINVIGSGRKMHDHHGEYVVYQLGLHPHTEISGCKLLNFIIVAHPYCDDEDKKCSGKLEDMSFDVNLDGAAQLIAVIELSAAQHGMKEALSAKLDQVRMAMRHDNNWWRDERTEN